MIPAQMVKEIDTFDRHADTDSADTDAKVRKQRYCYTSMFYSYVNSKIMKEKEAQANK